MTFESRVSLAWPAYDAIMPQDTPNLPNSKTPAEEGAAKKKTQERLTPIIVPLMLFTAGVNLLVYPSNPIQNSRDDQRHAVTFLEKIFPDEQIPWRTPAVAVVFDLIRSGDDVVAIQAINFATENGFGHAAPYVIRRLDSAHPELRTAAHGCLVQLANHDYGDSADAWHQWWRNPPRKFFGIPVGQRTLENSMPFMVIVVGFALWALQRSNVERSMAVSLIGIILVFSLFSAFIVFSLRLSGGPEEVMFAGRTVHYFTDHGVVLGLEDSRLGGGWVFFVFGFIWLLCSGILVAICGMIEKRLRF